MTEEDSTLVRGALAGERAAAEAPLARHFNAVWGVAYGITAHRSSADDVAQASFERAFRSLPSWTGEGEFGAWLRRIAVNQGLDHQRRQGRPRAREEKYEALQRTLAESDKRRRREKRRQSRKS